MQPSNFGIVCIKNKQEQIVTKQKTQPVRFDHQDQQTHGGKNGTLSSKAADQDAKPNCSGMSSGYFSLLH